MDVTLGDFILTDNHAGPHVSSWTKKLLRLLQGLEHSDVGRLLYQHIESTLTEIENQHGEITEAYSSLVHNLLDAYAAQLEKGSPEQVQVRLLQSRLQPPLTVSELKALYKQFTEQTRHLAQAREHDSTLRSLVAPLLKEFDADKTPPAEPRPNHWPARTVPHRPTPTPPIPPTAPKPPTAPTPADSKNEYGRRTEDIPAEGKLSREGQVLVDRRVNSAYRLHLDEKREEIHKLQSTLAKQVLESRRHNEEFGALLEVQLRALRQAGSIQKIEHARQILISEIEKLMHGERTLVHHLDSTHKYLHRLESDSAQLSEELNRVRLLSLTDELTSLPNRRAFMQRLEDETGRVKRYGYPLSLAIIDLDRFKAINDMRGHSAGDEVLRTYANHVLSIFRHHDLVARYGGEEFAALLPYTDKNGALCALRKVQKRSTEVSYHLSEKSYPLPTFSAGIAIYRPGESASTFIKRADNSLYRAKHLGRNRVEIDTGLKRGEEAISDFNAT